MKTRKTESRDERKVPEPPVNRRWLWFGLWGGGAAWLLHLLAVYVIAEFGCGSGLVKIQLLGISAVAWMAFVATAATGALAGWAAWVSWSSLRKIVAAEAALKVETDLFVARMGLISNGLFLLVIAAQTVPVFFYLCGCGGEGGT